jgi:hypothetical protein
VVPWSAAEDPPTSAEGPSDSQATPPDDYWLWQFGYPIEPTVASGMYDILVKTSGPSKRQGSDRPKLRASRAASEVVGHVVSVKGAND